MPESFPGIEGLKPLEGPGNIVPKILDPSVIDRRIKVTVEDAYTHCRSLARHVVFVGLSSGAHLRGALEMEPVSHLGPASSPSSPIWGSATSARGSGTCDGSSDS